MILNSILPEEFMALTIWGEGRGESIEGQVAIGNVIMNRFRKDSDKYKTLKDVCLEPKQFSCWNRDDPNREKLMELAKQIAGGTVSSRVWKQCVWVSKGIIGNQILDNTKGATNYLTNELFASPRCPKWASNPKQLLRIGNHSFFTA